MRATKSWIRHGCRTWAKVLLEVGIGRYPQLRRRAENRLAYRPVSILHTTLIFVVIPVAALLALGLWAMATAKPLNPSPKAYRLGDTWDRAPVLWTATDEVLVHGSQGHGSQDHGHAEIAAAPADLIGGSASGKW